MADRIHETETGPAPRWHPWLLFLLWLVLAPRAVDELVGTSVTFALIRTPGHTWFPLVTAAAQVIGLVLAGVALDRRGLRQVVGLGLAAWAILFAASAPLANAPLALFGVHEGSIVVGIFFGLAVPIAAKLAFPMERRARVLALLNLFAISWLLVAPIASATMLWPPRPLTSGSGLFRPDWSTGCVIVGGLVALLAALWWLSIRRHSRTFQSLESDAPPAEASLAETVALFRRPGIWALVAVMACHMQVLAVLHRVLVLYMVRERLLPMDRFMQSLVLPLALWAVAQLAFAIWSDLRVQRTRRSASARAPLAAAGALLTASIGLVPFASRDAFVAIYFALALGMAAFPLVFPLAFDTVPRPIVGRFFGLATALAIAVDTAIFLAASLLGAGTRSFVWYFYFAGAASLVAAGLTWMKLRALEPIEDHASFIGTIGKVFT